ncbi:putative DNA primase/helicase, partial [Acidocella aminolytica 101 = DSM 11237]
MPDYGGDIDTAGDMEGGYSAPRPNLPFQALGYDRSTFFFLPNRGGQVLEFSGRELGSAGALLQLAPLFWWESECSGKTGMDTKQANDMVLRMSYAAGPFDAGRVRGRGVWLEDDGRPVVHAGDHLAVDGQIISPTEWEGQGIYERAPKLGVSFSAEPAETEEAKRFLDLCAALPWEDANDDGVDTSSMGRMLAGWITVSAFCGAMPWRPHVWITSEAGQGKSWLLDNILKPMLGGAELRVQSKTTEAGLRAALGRDARPVVFDEAETQNQRDADRMQQVLDLARQASSEDGADIVKSTQTGQARRFRIRSMFAFASVNVALSQAADESRTIVLSLRPARDKDARAAHFEKLKSLQAEIVTPGFAARLRARTLSLLPTIRANAEVFASAIARAGGSRRTGDTVGVPLAGAWSLRSRRTATREEADAFVAGTPWVRAAVERIESEPEWRQCLNRLLGQRIRLPGRVEEVPVGELLDIVGTPYSTPEMAGGDDMPGDGGTA